ncbi:Hpt domain-containing protein [Pseudotabrizicola sp. L79]|uniref:Hpt domain-containing protein n=1 Tax=Pseudotabrizicola sp. L79 TaxID=3118402 RepID=UPI002F933018
MIDWNRVRDLRSEVGNDDFDEIITMFLEETDAIVARLSASLPTSRLESDLHFLKGSALNIGFASFARLCQIGEKQAADVKTDVPVAAIITAYRESRAELLSHLAKGLVA